MQLYNQIVILCLALSTLTVVSCGDPSPVGAGVLDGERLDLAYTSDFDITAQTIDNTFDVLTYRAQTEESAALAVANRIIGGLQDPVTGHSYAEAYLELTLGSTPPDFEDATVDSVVLSIAYDTRGSYGDTEEAHTVEISALSDVFPEVDTIFADRQVMTSQAIGSRTFVPAPEDTILIINQNGRVEELIPQMRIRLDNSFGQDIIDDPDIIDSDSSLRAYIPGILIASDAVNSTFGLDLSSSTNNGSATPNGITIYYEIDDTTRASYMIEIGSKIAGHMRHDKSTGTVQVSDTLQGDSIVVVQGLAGVNAEITLGSLDQVSDEVINYAQLVMFVARDPMIDPDWYSPHEVIAGQYPDDGTDDELRTIEDFAIAVAVGNETELFGGIPQDTVVDGQALEVVTLNITSHVKTLVADPTLDRRLVLSLASKIQRPGRTVLYGPGHSRFPMRLNVIYTDIQ